MKVDEITVSSMNENSYKELNIPNTWKLGSPNASTHRYWPLSTSSLANISADEAEEQLLFVLNTGTPVSPNSVETVPKKLKRHQVEVPYFIVSWSKVVSPRYLNVNLWCTALPQGYAGSEVAIVCPFPLYTANVHDLILGKVKTFSSISHLEMMFD